MAGYGIYFQSTDSTRRNIRVTKVTVTIEHVTEEQATAMMGRKEQLHSDPEYKAIEDYVISNFRKKP